MELGRGPEKDQPAVQPGLLQDGAQLAAQRRFRGAGLRRDRAEGFARHELRRKPGLRERQSEIGREVRGLGGSRIGIDYDDEGHRVGGEAEIDAEGRDGKDVVVFAALPADEDAAAGRRRLISGRRGNCGGKFGGFEHAGRAERALLEYETVASPNNPLGQSVHLDDKTMCVDDDNAGRDLVERARHDGRFPSELSEPELNLGRSAERLQQLIQTFEARWGKRLFANSLVNAENDSVRPGIADLSSNDVSHPALQNEVIVPFVLLQFRRRQLFGEAHPCPLMTGEEFSEGILRGKAGDVV